MKQPSQSKRGGQNGGKGPDEPTLAGEFEGLSPEMRKAIESIGSEVLQEPIPARLLRAAKRLAEELHAKRTGTRD